MGILLESIEDVIKHADVSKVENGGQSALLNGLGVIVKFVKRGSIQNDMVLLDDVVERKVDLPILSDDMAIGVYNFFNAALTNYYNRKLISGLCDVIVGESSVDQVKVKIGNYAEDREDFINEYVNKDDRFSKLVNLISMTYTESVPEETLKSLKEYFPATENMVPLIFLYKLDFIKLDNVKLPTSKRLRNGETMLLLDPAVTLPDSGLNKNRPIENEVVVITEDNEYLIGKSFNNRTTIREIECGELFTYKIFPYNLNGKNK